MTEKEHTMTIPEKAVEAAARYMITGGDVEAARQAVADLFWREFADDVRGLLAAALPHLGEPVASQSIDRHAYRVAHLPYPDAAPHPAPATLGEAELDLRTLVPNFRLDWSGLRDRFEDEALQLEKLTTYESRAAHLDEMARQFEDAVTTALAAANARAEKAGREREEALPNQSEAE